MHTSFVYFAERQMRLRSAGTKIRVVLNVAPSCKYCGRAALG